MKTTLTKIISICVVLAMLLALSFTLIACDNGDKGPSLDEQYNNSINGFKVAVMTAKNAEWSKSLSDDELAKRDDAGEYILYEEGLDFVASILKKSNILPQQIDSITELFKKQEVKEIFKKLEENENPKERNEAFLKALLPMIRNDFSSSEIALVFYELLYGISENIDNVFFNVYAHGKDVYDKIDPSKPNLKLLDVAQISLNIHKYFNPKNAQVKARQEKLLTDIQNAKEGILGLGEFAYDVAFNSVYDSIKSHVGDNGALTGITENEIKQTLLSILDNFKALRKTLTPQNMEYINVAFANILNTFQGVFLNDGIISQLSDILSSLITQINTVYFSLDLLPTVCDVVIKSESMIKNDSAFVNELFNVLMNEEYNLEANRYIMLSKVINNVIEQETKGDEKALIKNGKEFVNGLFKDIDNRKLTPLKDGSLKIDKMVGIIGLDLVIQYGKLMKSDGSHNEQVIETLFEPMLTYGAYKRLRIDFNAAKAGIRVGSDPNETPYRSVYIQFCKNEKWLLSPLGVILKNWPSQQNGTEDECRDFLLGVLEVVEGYDYETSLYKYMLRAYSTAKADLLTQVENFANVEYKDIVVLANHELFKKIDGVEQTEEYKNIMKIIASFVIPTM